MSGRITRTSKGHPARPSFLRNGEAIPSGTRSANAAGTPHPLRNEADRHVAAGGCRARAAAHEGRARARGFTLIELMIAMILGLIVIAGVTSVFLAGQKSYRTNAALGEVESNSRIAFEFLARDIRQAGLTGCDTSNGRIANTLNPGKSGVPWWQELGNAVHGYDGDSTLTDPALTQGTDAGDWVPGTDSLQIIGANNSDVGVADMPGHGKSADIKITKPSSWMHDGSIIMICDADHATILQVSQYNNKTNVVHNTGGDQSPGNCSHGLGYPTECKNPGNAYVFPYGSLIFQLGASDWYIGYNGQTLSNGDLGKSLYHLAAVDGSASAQEMVRNVTNMQITYLQNPNTDFVPATQVTNWAAVSSVRVTLTAESNFQRATVDFNPVVRTYAATTTIRNRVD